MKAQPTYQDRMHRVLRYIEDNLDNPPGLDELGRVACFSSCHFHRIFTAMVGESVAAYIRRLRLQRAAQQLKYSRRSVTEIAFDAGYERLEVFTRAYRAFFGVSPSDYRRSGRATALQGAEKPESAVFYHLNPEVFPVNVKIKTFPPVLVAALRHTGPYNECGPLWAKLCGALAPHNLINETSAAYSICHDDPDVTPAEKCRMEICVTLREGVTEQTPAIQDILRDSEIYLRHIGGGGEYAAVLVKGPYTLLHPVYRSLYGEWLPQSGREPDRSPGIEAYYNDPTVTAPDELLTEIFIPLEPR